ncbi:AlpA family transcriptional regulator [Marichromatium sp. AB32]|uniref:helix-turn-helix transcriptional regulator n=1 Tax=Marichromatium sp. AB32 TaxID=2483363 RepID=UPI000F3C6AE3|nr:helix-turn-helix domain-containing protein [Marichromatium sp. AB32]RNE91428.1 DNA-binding protein [Marichromatium sp. AB32]
MSHETLAPSVARGAAADEKPTENRTFGFRVKEEIEPRWLRAKQASAYVGISYDHLQKLREKGRGPQWRKVGGIVLYDVQDLDAYILSHPAKGGR